MQSGTLIGTGQRHVSLQNTKLNQYYHWHKNKGVNNKEGEIRKLSCTVQLSFEEYKGGQLQMRTHGEEFTVNEIAQGSICVFSGFVQHRVTVTEGVRQSLVIWSLGCTYR